VRITNKREEEGERGRDGHGEKNIGEEALGRKKEVELGLFAMKIDKRQCCVIPESLLHLTIKHGSKGFTSCSQDYSVSKDLLLLRTHKEGNV